MKTKIPLINIVEQHHQKVTYFPFENELDLCCMLRIERDNRSIGAFLLNQGDISDETKFQVIFPFHLKGIHDQLYREEVLEISNGISEAMKSILFGERCTFLLGRYSEESHRQQHLNHLAESCSLKLPAILMRNEQARIQELTRKGARSIWQQMVFCTWTADEFGSGKTDTLWSCAIAISLLKSGWKHRPSPGDGYCTPVPF
ncbi:hypothetical protein [Fischerella sp. NIES-3754]|uniref:hypothetical protein n=1 Tax=Fischerella sp. NIES-3754 TaxID=1752063 RepID=UPI00071F82B3|nr:hypothetical protein [Fischerella sp. NIES-3754]BAU08423.1 hypothetical protein FIS3754_43670 [Fischerella sp. NIES-3754]BCX10795.1 MAG: hypothetical protein KatS3mg066_4654 [Fischerella sp.]